MRGMRIFAMMMLCPAVALCADKPLPMAYDVAVIGGGAAGIAGEALELMDNVLKEGPEEERKVREKERKEKEKIAAKEKAKNARKKARELRKAKREEEKAKLAANR